MTSLDLQNAQRLESEQANHAITTLRKNSAFFENLNSLIWIYSIV